MKLIDNARKVILKAWSIRLALISALLSATEVALTYVAPERPSGLFALGAFVVAIAAAISRIIAQPSMHSDNE